MKSSIVPAQITTVEDKVAGNLSLSQMFLLTAPVFIGTLIYLVFPPSMGAATYKLVLVLVIAVIFGLLAVRIKGRLAVLWVATIGRYNLRPRYFVLDKNDMYLRGSGKGAQFDIPKEPMAIADYTAPILPPKLSTTETVMLEGIIANPAARLHFKTDRKGALRVSITEVK